MDLALVAHAATLEPGFPSCILRWLPHFARINKIEMLTEDDMRALINMDRVAEHRQRALSPDHPVLRGTAQNPMSIFKRVKLAILLRRLPDKVQAVMDKFAQVVAVLITCSTTWRARRDRVIVMMVPARRPARTRLSQQKGEKVGLLKVRLYRPFSVRASSKLFRQPLRRSLFSTHQGIRSWQRAALSRIVNGIHEGIKLGYGS